MDTTLQSPPFPISLIEGAESSRARTFTVQCHDRIFQKVTVRDEENEEIFTAEGPRVGFKSAWRRKVKGSSGMPLFELRHPSLSLDNPWIVESATGAPMCTVKHRSKWDKQHSALDVTVLNAADRGREVNVEVRPNDRSALTTLVNVEGSCIAEIRLIGSNDVTSLEGQDRSSWQARVAPGVDLALILIIVLCRAEMHHVWRQ